MRAASYCTRSRWASLVLTGNLGPREVSLHNRIRGCIEQSMSKRHAAKHSLLSADIFRSQTGGWQKSRMPKSSGDRKEDLRTLRHRTHGWVETSAHCLFGLGIDITLEMRKQNAASSQLMSSLEPLNHQGQKMPPAAGRSGREVFPSTCTSACSGSQANPSRFAEPVALVETARDSACSVFARG